jgi:hypothetical protein
MAGLSDRCTNVCHRSIKKLVPVRSWRTVDGGSLRKWLSGSIGSERVLGLVAGGYTQCLDELMLDDGLAADTL